MESKYKLSVVVLVYNTEQYLRECLDSLVQQTLEGIEIILVNDSSPDNSHLIIEGYCQRYNHIKVINQENSGGAIAGNNGLKIASGEYVTVMDSDDIVPLDAYEKLYNKAKETDAEIVIGKPNILIEGIQKEILYKQEREVWTQERVITNVSEFPDIFYDGFYWNKIYKRDLIFNYNCFMPPGMLYADRPMVHRAFLHAKKIAIITDIVYLWRKRGNDVAQKSITQLNGDINNFRDRMESCNYQIAYFEEYGNVELTNEFLKRNVDRFFFPINNIVYSKEFRDVFFAEIKPLLQRIENVYDNDLGITKNLYIYMILNDLREELLVALSSNLTGEVMKEDGKFYWKLPYFRNPSIHCPDHLFEIKVLREDFIHIDSACMENNCITFNGIEIPETFHLNQAELIIQSRFDVEDVTSYALQHEENNQFSVNVSLDDYDVTNIYDIYLFFDYNNRQEKYRVSKVMFEGEDTTQLLGNNETYRLYFTKNQKLSFRITNFGDLNIACDKNKLSIETSSVQNDSFIFCLKDRRTKERIHLQRKGVNQYEIKWEHFLEKCSTYDLYYRVFEQDYRLNMNNLVSFKGKTLKFGGVYVNAYKTNKDNISLKTYTFIDKITAKIKSVLKNK
ncbi:glycosyltransferase family 2 protein [Microbacteriaceae bacterium 4G12]